MHEPAALPIPAGALDESELIRAARADPGAFQAIYERYADRVYRYLLTRSRSPDDAADLLQQVFLRAMDALSQYRPEKGPFVAWLFGIARNAATDFQRRSRPTVSWDMVPESFLAGRTDLEAEVLRRDDLARLAALVGTLDPARRELLVLRFVAGLTVPEIAAVIGKREAATKKQILRTLQSLKERYHDRTP